MVNSQAYEISDRNEENRSSNLTYTIGNGHDARASVNLQLSQPQPESQPQNNETPAKAMKLGYLLSTETIYAYQLSINSCYEVVDLTINTLHILSNLQQIATVDRSRWASLENPMNKLTSNENPNLQPALVFQLLKIKTIQGKSQHIWYDMFFERNFNISVK